MWIDAKDELPDKEILELGEDMRSDQVIVVVKLVDDYYIRQGKAPNAMPHVTTAYIYRSEWYWHENNKKMSADFEVIKWQWLPNFYEQV